MVVSVFMAIAALVILFWPIRKKDYKSTKQATPTNDSTEQYENVYTDNGNDIPVSKRTYDLTRIGDVPRDPNGRFQRTYTRQ